MLRRRARRAGGERTTLTQTASRRAGWGDHRPPRAGERLYERAPSNEAGKRKSRLAISLSALATIGAALVLAPTAAWTQGPTVVTYSGTPESGAEISLDAAPGTQNRIIAVLIGVRDTPVIKLQDEAGVAVASSPHCGQAGPTEVRCDATGLERLDLESGDLDDRLRLRLGDPTPDDANEISLNFAHVHIDAGSGNDFVSSFFGDDQGLGDSSYELRSGNDRATLSGPGTLHGDAGNDLLRGRAGPQHIFGKAGNDKITCGKGKDRAAGGPGKDRGGAGCERVVAGDFLDLESL